MQAFWSWLTSWPGIAVAAGVLLFLVILPLALVAAALKRRGLDRTGSTKGAMASPPGRGTRPAINITATLEIGDSWTSAVGREVTRRQEKIDRPPAAEPGSQQQGGQGGPSDGAAPSQAGEPVTDLPTKPEADEYRVWYGTNRKPRDAADDSKGFSGARGGTVRYGYCDVLVPESHKIGSVGSSAWKRLLAWTDDRLKVREVGGLERDAFWTAVAKQLEELPETERDAVVFIHGYSVSFEEAALRAAQIGFDLGIGTMAFFSWPSRGLKTRRAYQSDGQTIGASAKAIAAFLADFSTLSGARRVHVIVHSMGNEGVLRATQHILADAQRRAGCGFGQFILAAADVDAETFEQLADAYRQLSQRTTLYVSRRDLALKASAWFAEYPRVGLYPPVSVFNGIDTVSVSNIDLTLLGHGYVGEARDVLQDMHRLIFTGAPPPRFGLKRRANGEGKTYWEVQA